MTLDGVVKPTFDVFLSYNGADRAIVRRVARRLLQEGIQPWFDKYSLTPGMGWQDQLAARLKDCRACAVFVGGQPIVGWERNEMELALDRAARDRDFRVFPVLLPGVNVFDSSVLPDFLGLQEWVDLRDDPESATAIQSIINATRGVALRPPLTVSDGRQCPYRGLGVFEEEHAPFFFGRGAQVQRLLEVLRQGRFLAVIGQSGVGKSSLVRAGLLARLQTGALPGSADWRVLRLRPGILPATMLTAKVRELGPSVERTVDRYGTGERSLNDGAVVALADEPDNKLVVVVDQFEELFTVCRNAKERADFLKNLHYAATYPDGPVVVVVAMRSDFYPRLAQFPAFAQLAQGHQVHVPPMSAEELRDVILEPAAAVGMTVEPGLDRDDPGRHRPDVRDLAVPGARAVGDLAAPGWEHAHPRRATTRPAAFSTRWASARRRCTPRCPTQAGSRPATCSCA